MATRSNDYYLTITESKRRYNDDGYTYEKHKIFLYKEDFNKFMKAFNKTVDYVKEELLPEVDFDKFDRDREEHFKAKENGEPSAAAAKPTVDADSDTKTDSDEAPVTESEDASATESEDTSATESEDTSATESEDTSVTKSEDTSATKSEDTSPVENELNWD